MICKVFLGYLNENIEFKCGLCHNKSADKKNKQNVTLGKLYKLKRKYQNRAISSCWSDIKFGIKISFLWILPEK